MTYRRWESVCKSYIHVCKGFGHPRILVSKILQRLFHRYLGTTLCVCIGEKERESAEVTGRSLAQSVWFKNGKLPTAFSWTSDLKKQNEMKGWSKNHFSFGTEHRFYDCHYVCLWKCSLHVMTPSHPINIWQVKL
jgi:hypothetical protein